MLRTHRGTADRAPTPANDVAALQNEQVVYVPDDNYRNPFREAKHQRDLQNDYFNHVGHLLGRRTGSEMWQPNTLGQKKLTSISPCQDYPIIPRILFKLVLLKFSTNFRRKSKTISNKFQNYFKPNHKSTKTVEKLQPKLCKNVPNKSQNS